MLLASGSGINAQERFTSYSPRGHFLHYEVHYGDIYLINPQANYANPQPYISGALIIPDSVEYNGINKAVVRISERAFINCTGMTSVVIPESVTLINASAFYNCTNLVSVTIGNNVTSIGDEAFRNCIGLNSIVIPNSVTSIWPKAFMGCSGMTSISIGNSVTTISQEAFRDCSGLNSLVIPNSVTSIGQEAFLNCSGLNSVIIGSGVTTIGQNAFSFCSSLSSIVVDESNTYYDSRDNCNAIIQTNYNLLLRGCNTTIIPNSVSVILNNAFKGSGLTSIVIPDNVNSIGNAAFYQCSALTSIYISNNVALINDSVFSFCSNLTSINLPSGITSINNMAFYYCSSIRSINIPSSVTNIGGGAFVGCNNLTSIYFRSETPPYRYPNWDDMPNSANFYVPCNFVDIYHNNASWSSYASRLWGNPYLEYNCVFMSNNDTMGDVSVSEVNCDSNIVITATANTNYQFYGWSDGENVNPRTIHIDGDTSVMALFGLASYSVLGQPSDTIRGMVSGGDTLFFGDTVTLTAEPYYGYHFTQWNDGLTDNPRNITVTGDTIFTAFFQPNTYSVFVYSVDTLKGTVSGSNDEVNYLGVQNVSASAATENHFTHWSDGSVNALRSITVTQDTTLTAFFEPNSYVIIGQPSNTSRGIVNGSDTIQYGDSTTLIAIPNYGYYFQRWNDNNTDNPRTVVVTQNKTYTAYFNPNSYTIMLHSADSSQGNVIGSGSFNYLTNRQIKALPITGHHFTHWSDGDSNATRTISVIQDTVLTAYFEINSYQLTVLPNDSTLGSVTGSGVYTHGTQVTVTATPAQGVRFDRWNDNTLLKSYTFTLTNNKQLIAVFLPIDTVFIHDTTYLWQYDTTYINNYIHDTTIVDNWIHDTTYLWQYDTTYINNYIHDTTIVDNWIYDTTIVVDTLWLTQYDTVWLTLYDTVWLHDTIIVHDTIYVTQEGIGDVAESSIKLYQSNGQIVVEGAAGKAVYMYDINGRLLMRRTENEERRTFDVPVSGAYLIKVGELPARKIVVIR